MPAPVPARDGASGGGAGGAAAPGDPDSAQGLAMTAMVEQVAVEALCIGAGPRGSPPAEVVDGARRLAGLWEGLLEASRPESVEWFALNAACAYEIAGIHGSVRRMAGLAMPGGGGGGSGWSGASLQRAAAMLLRRRLVELRAYCKPIVAEPDYEKVDNIAYRLSMASAAAALSDLAGAMLSGSSPDMDGIDECLVDAQRLFDMSGFGNESGVVYSIRSLLGTIWSRSAWDGGDGQGGAGEDGDEAEEGRGDDPARGRRRDAGCASAGALDGAASGGRGPGAAVEPLRGPGATRGQ